MGNIFSFSRFSLFIASWVVSKTEVGNVLFKKHALLLSRK